MATAKDFVKMHKPIVPAIIDAVKDIGSRMRDGLQGLINPPVPVPVRVRSRTRR